MSKRNNKKNRGKTLPTIVEIFQGTRSEIAQAAIFRSGAGFHADKRDRKERKGSWKNEDWG
jgi:hypothetical protein